MDNQRLNVILGADDEPLKSGLKDSISIIDSYTKKIEDSNTSIGQTRKMLKELKRMNIEAFDDAQLQKYDSLMASLTDSAGDYDAKIKSLSLDPFQKYAEGMSSAVTMGTGLANAITLIGGNDEQLQKIMQKTIALQGVANALQEASIFFKERAMGITIKQKATEFAAWASTVTISEAATVSVAKFNAVLAANPITAVIVAVLALGAAIYGLIKYFDDTEERLEAINKQGERLKELAQEQKEKDEFLIELSKIRGATEAETAQMQIDSINKQIVSNRKYVENEKQSLALLDSEKRKDKIKELNEVSKQNDRLAGARALLNERIKVYNAKEVEENKKKLAEIYKNEFFAKIDRIKLQADIAEQIAQLSIKINSEYERATEERIAKAKEEAERLTILKNDIYGKIIAKYDVEVIIETEEESEAVRWAQKEKQRIEDQLSEMNGMLESGVEDMISTFAEGLGQLASGEIGFEEFGNMILGQVGSFAKMFGQALIGYGVAMEAFKKTFSNPWAAIATGAALVALGAVLGGLAKQAPSPKGGGGGGASSGGSQNMNMGWDKIRATTNQEAIHVNVGGEFRVQGASLVATVKNEDNRVNNW